MRNLFSELAKTDYGYKASLMDFSEVNKIKIPKQIKDEIPTLNRQGFMKLELDEYSKLFVERAKDIEWSIDIGGAYGFVVHKALEEGNNVIAFDLSFDHLAITGANAKEEYKNRLFLQGGRFPQEFNFSNKKIGSILASRIMHFLDGQEIMTGLSKIHETLEEGGKFYFTSVTPYHSAIKDGYLEKYKEKKRAGYEWPGVIENQWEINPDHKEFVERYLHVFDVPQLESLLPKHGFKIDKISLFDYPNDTDSKGKGHVGFIATKV